jgi:hypothetical protein
VLERVLRFAFLLPRLRSSQRSNLQEILSMNKCMVILAVAIFSSAILNAQQLGWPPLPDHLTVPVWPGAAPGAGANLPPEADITTAKDGVIAGRPLIRLGNVSTPTLTLSRPGD